MTLINTETHTTESVELTPEQLQNMSMDDKRVVILKLIALCKIEAMDCITRNMYRTVKYNMEQCIILEDMLCEEVV